MSRIEETLSSLVRQMAVLTARTPEAAGTASARSEQPSPQATVPSAPPASSSASVPRAAARRALETTLLPDLSRAEAGLRAYDAAGRRAAAAFLEGNGGQVYVYDQDGRPLHPEW